MAPHHARLHYIQQRHQQASQEPQAKQSCRTRQTPSTGTTGTLRGDRTILEAIFMKSLDTKKLPDDWKSDNVVPIYKKRIETSTSQLTTSLPDLHMLQTNGTYRGEPDR